MSAYAHVGLAGERLAAVFPFHFVLDRHLRVVQAGASLQRTCPGLVHGATLEGHLALEHPVVDAAWDALVAHRDRPFVFRTPAGLGLRGQCVPLPDADVLLFVCTPQVFAPAELQAHGLTGADFALHDPLPELLQVVHSHFTALQEARRAVDRADIQLEELRRSGSDEREQRKSRMAFLAGLAREVRNSVNGNVGLLQLLLDTPLDPEQRDSVQSMLRSSHALLSLLNDVLDYASLQFADFTREVATYDLHKTFSDVVETDAPHALDKGLGVRLEIAPDVPRYALGPSLRVHQVLHKLLDNAIKYTDGGTITVRLRLASHYEVGFALRAEVQDTGTGISRDKQPLLFQEFSRLEAESRSGSAGAGLGLAICQRILKLMEGLIGVDSIPGKGSTFWFTFHQGEPSEQDIRALQAHELYGGCDAVSADAEPEAEPEARAPHVLLAEDSPVNQKVAQRILERLGCTCDVAENGREALQLFFEREYDLVLMDCQMPEMDGYEAAQAIRARAPQGRARVPIVALTANSSPADRARASRSGMDGFVTKPVRLEVLERALSHFFGRRLHAAA